MFRCKLFKAVRFVVGVPLLTLVLTMLGPIGPANAGGGPLITFANDCMATGTASAPLAVITVTPSGFYTWSYDIKDLTTHWGYGHTNIYPSGFNGPFQFNSQTVVVHPGDVIKLTFTAGSTTGVDYPCGGAPSSGVPVNFNDGRCNQEPWQAFAVYPDNKGGYYFYVLYQGIGYFAMHVTEKDLDNNPDTGVNHIIAQAQGIQLWRLAGGLLQAHRIGMDNKDYSFNIACGMMEDGD